jgi:hypothetical protein
VECQPGDDARKQEAKTSFERTKPRQRSQSIPFPTGLVVHFASSPLRSPTPRLQLARVALHVTLPLRSEATNPESERDR